MRSGEDLAAHYASADLFLFPSKTETFGNVTTEALASGLCVVAYDYAAAADIIKNNLNGVTVKLDNESAFIAEATELAMNPKKLAEVRANAFESIANLDWDKIHESFETILRDVITSTLMLSKKDIPITKFIHDETSL